MTILFHPHSGDNGEVTWHRDTPNTAQSKTDVVGVDYDPYGRVDADGYDQYTNIHPAWIPWHNYRQIHVTLDALYAGYSATRPLPTCPPLWGDVAHYWDFGVFTGHAFYELVRVFGGLMVAMVMLYAASKGIQPIDIPFV